MPIVQSVNATNASYAIQYGQYTDFNIWVLILTIAIILMIASRCLNQRDDVGRLIIATLSVIFSLVAVLSSLSVAHIGYTNGATSIINGSTNSSMTYNYIYPVQQVVTSPWLTGICIVLLIFTFLNAVDIFLVMMQRPTVDDTKKKGGRGIRI
jgi:hypothetical protein